MKQPKVDLERLKNKIQFERIIILLSIAVSAAFVTDGVLLIYSRFVYVYGLFELMLVVPIAYITLGIIAGLFLRPSDMSAAAVADSCGYAERFVTAVGLADKTELTEMESLVLEDARRITSEVRLDRKYTVKIPKSILLLFLASVVLFAVCLLIHVKKTERVQSLEDMHQRFDTAIEAMSKDIDESKLDDEKKVRIKAELAELKKELAKTNDKAETTQQLMKAQAELKKIADSDEGEQIKQLGDKLSEKTGTKTMGEALKNNDIDEFNKQIEKLNDSLDSLSEEELSSIGSDLRAVADSMEADTKIKESLNKLADTMQAKPSDRQSGEISTELKELSERVNELDGQNGDVSEAVSKINRELARLGNNAPTASNGGEAQGDGNEAGEKAVEGGSGRGSGSVANENVYSAKAKNYGDYAAELDDKAENGSGDEQRSYVDGERGSVVPYGEVLGEYKREAINAVEKDSIPYGVKDIVRDYFGSLE